MIIRRVRDIYDYYFQKKITSVPFFVAYLCTISMCHFIFFKRISNAHIKHNFLTLIIISQILYDKITLNKSHTLHGIVQYIVRSVHYIIWNTANMLFSSHATCCVNTWVKLVWYCPLSVLGHDTLVDCDVHSIVFFTNGPLTALKP